MAAYTSILLLAALCIGTAHSLQCYTCIAATSNSNCQTPVNCTSGQTQCQTDLTSASIAGISVTTISKSCSSSCTATSTSVSLVSYSTSCCSTNLCNVSGAVSIKSTYSAIFLVLGTVAMLFSSSLL